MSAPRGSLLEFLDDIEPLFYRRSLLYVDVGAYKGEVFKKVLASQLKIREAHLLEPNPDSVEALRRNIDGLFKGHILAVHPLAAGAKAGTVRLRLAESMSKVVSSESVVASGENTDTGVLSVECRTLDELSLLFSERHISLLKIDAEGYEDQVLGGAASLLSAQEVDVVYVEAGMNPSGTQQCYYRTIDDILLGHGYRLFRIYEQKHEWQEDSPFLRRADLAYLSPRFAAQSPYLLARELFQARQELLSVHAQRDELTAQIRTFAGAEAVQRKALASEQRRCRALRVERKELSERTDALQRELTALTRHVVALEGSAQVDGLTRDELKQRLGMMTESHQTQLVQLAEARQAQRDLERQLDQRGDELGRVQRLLYESEQSRNALSSQRDALTVELESSAGANVALEQQVRRAREEYDRLNSLRQGEREAYDRALEEQQTRQQELQVHEKQRDLARHQEAGRTQRELKRLKDALDTSEAIAREVFQVYDALSRRESQARSEALRARSREERTRAHLSYRVGAVLVTHARAPLQWATIPVALGRAYGDFRRESKGRQSEPAPEVQEVLGELRKAHVSLRQQWTALRLQSSEVQEVWVRALTVRPERAVAIEVLVAPNLMPTGPEAARDQEGCTARADTESVLTVELRSGVAQRLLRLDPSRPDMTLKVRKVRGVPTILHLELRPEDATQAATPGSGDNRSPNPPASASGAPAREPSAVRALLSVPGTGHKPARVRTKRGSFAHAIQVIREGDFERGIEYALASASDVERPAIELLYANHVLADERGWLQHLNAYVRQFQVAPIELRAEPTSRYLRLHAHLPRKIDSGPVVSVIMPAFNAARTLEFAARSILDQTWRPLELIIVDDASHDTTWSIALALAREDSRVKVFRNAANVGPYVSKNLGLLAARGAYVTGHDADDWAHPERIENHVAAMLRGGAKASLIKMLRLSNDGEFCRMGHNTPNRDDGVLQTAFISCMLETRFLRTRLGNWDSVRFGADSELISRTRFVLGGDLPVYRQLGLFCLESQEGLTADPTHGVSSDGGLSPTRTEYKQTFVKWHESLAPEEAYLPFPHQPRRFAAPAVALVPDDLITGLKARMVQRVGEVAVAVPSGAVTGGNRSVDVCIVTNLSFPGGNASSTLDEVNACLGAGLTVRLIHCPVPRDEDKDICERFKDYLHLCDDGRSQHEGYHCEVLIVRHPGVICAPQFPKTTESLRAQTTVVVINNSMFRANGARVYSDETLCERIAALPGARKKVYPLGPAIRRELLSSSLAGRLDFATIDWSPTFSPDDFRWRTPRPMGRPIVIGRHGRDGREKWLEDPEQLMAVYPRSQEVRVKILGGAECAEKVLGEEAQGWQVHAFGSLSAADFLSGLDAFVYFPNSGLNEAFGRAIMEAIFVGVPCVVPTRFQETFGRVAFCCEAGEAIPAVRRLDQSYAWCAAFVERARALVIPEYGSQAVLCRLRSVSEVIAARIAVPALQPRTALDVDGALSAYARWVSSGQGASRKYTNGTPSDLLPAASIHPTSPHATASVAQRPG
jgi:FkbM family methyltransferase